MELWELCPHGLTPPHVYWTTDGDPDSAVAEPPITGRHKCPGGKKHEVVTEIGVHADGTHTLPMPTGLPPGRYLLVRED